MFSDFNKLRPLDNQSIKRLTQVIQTAEEEGNPEPKVSLHDLRRAAMCLQLIIQPDMFTPKARESIVALLRDYYNKE